jgi:pyruvate/2-oxoglutarate dehydrogenase complex dihydrolipoamide acyltransferase (E2) component
MAMEHTTILAWHHREGDSVETGDVLCEIETEKVSAVIEAPASGVLARILAPAGSTVAVGSVIATLTVGGSNE